MATLKDVAVLAGVSVKTVSNVVNGYDFVKPENRRRVEEALSTTGYRPHIGARNLRRGRTGFIALVVPELSIPYFGELAGGVIAAAAAMTPPASSPKYGTDNSGTTSAMNPVRPRRRLRAPRLGR